MSIPMEAWGKDHWSVFAYVETLCVDSLKGVGVPDVRKVQCNAGRHPGLLAYSPVNQPTPYDGTAYAIRLGGKWELVDYDEWDCLEDAEVAGLLEHVGTGHHPAYCMTDLGNRLAGQLRTHKANGGRFATFKPE